MTGEISESKAAQKTIESERLSYLNISFSDKGVAEYSGQRCVVFIPREGILKIENDIGSRSERPLIQGIAGSLLAVLGFAGILMIMQGGWGLFRWEAGFLVFGGIGVWLIIEVLRQGHFLRVTGSKETRKLVFNGKVVPSDLQEFLKKAEKLGYNCL